MMTFLECLEECLESDEFVREFDRLAGCHLARPEERPSIVAMVDAATGFDDAKHKLEIRKFVAFVYEVVWLRLSPRVRAEVVRPPPGQSFAELMGEGK